MALGEANTALVAQQARVKVGGRCEVERALQQDLARGGLQQVGSADHFGDLLEGIVDDAGELIAGQADIFWIVRERAAPDEEVAEAVRGADAPVRCGERGEGLRAEVEVVEADRLAVGNAEAVVAGSKLGDRRWLRRAAAAGVDGFIVFFMWGGGGLRKVAAGAGAAVDEAACEQLLEGGAVGGEARGLGEHRRRPRNAEPGEVFEHGGEELRAGALRVEVLVAEEQRSALLLRAPICGPECRGMAEVEQAGGRWREAADVASVHGMDGSWQHGCIIFWDILSRKPSVMSKLADLDDCKIVRDNLRTKYLKSAR